VVGGGVLEALVRGGDAEGRAVVEGAVVESDAPAARHGDHARHRRRPVGPEHRLRGLHLDLEAQPARRQAVRRLEPLADLDHGRDLVDRGDLRESEQEPFGQAAGVHQRVEHHGEGAQAAAAGWRFEALEADAEKGRPAGRLRHRGQLPGDFPAGAVLLLVGADAVPVLEVHSQVLDRFADQLGPHPVVDVGDHSRGHAGGVRQGGGSRGVVVEQRQRGPAPLGGQAGGEAVGRDVDGVHGLAAARVAGIPAGERLVGRGEPPVEQVGEIVDDDVRLGSHGVRTGRAGDGHGASSDLGAGRRGAGCASLERKVVRSSPVWYTKSGQPLDAWHTPLPALLQAGIDLPRCEKGAWMPTSPALDEAVERFSAMSDDAGREALRACCASSVWVERVWAARPFRSRAELLDTAEAACRALNRAAVEEALAGHPRIGDRATGQSPEARWSRQEQASVTGTDEETRDALLAGNRAYERRFGHVFLIRAAGRSAAEMLTELRRRLANDAATERREVVDQLAQITRLRVERLLDA
jgi:2-oxo-4-hydroxy-4-carboxy-5-ureidoimidazoline decarboxylase